MSAHNNNLNHFIVQFLYFLLSQFEPHHLVFIQYKLFQLNALVTQVIITTRES